MVSRYGFYGREAAFEVEVDGCLMMMRMRMGNIVCREDVF